MTSFLSNAVKITILLNPFAVLSTFMALAGDKTVAEKKKIVLGTCAASLIAGLVILFSGELIFTLLGINIDLFKAGGGVVLMVCAVSLVWGKETAAADNQTYQAVAVVPLAIPMAVGPGTAAGLIVIGMEPDRSFAEMCSDIGALTVGISVLAAVLAPAIWSNRMLSRTTVAIISRLCGLFLSAIAAQMIIEGVKKTLFS